MKKYKPKKSFIVLLILIIIIIFLFHKIISHKDSYSLEYSYDDIKISENYDKDKDEYYYELFYNKNKYSFITEIQSTKKSKLINKVEKYQDDDYVCLKVESSYFDSQILCSYQNELIDFHLASEEILNDLNIKQNNKDDYSSLLNYKVYNKDSIYIWNYKGLLNIATDEEIKIFNKDIYETNLISIINNYILIPNYEEELNFSKIYILDMNNQKITTWDLEYNLSFDSVVLGVHDKSLFILDKSQKIEYELVPHKKKMRIVGNSKSKGIIYNKGTIKNVSLENIISNNLSFTYDNSYNYFLNNNTVYLNYYNKNDSIRITNNVVTKIIATNNKTVYYLVNDQLYKYSPQIGEILLVQYDDWNYNSQNMIFPYNEKTN